MEPAGIPNVYLVVIAGIAIWLTGQKVGSYTLKRWERPSQVGKLLSFVGIVVFGVGVYAGFKGPLTIAGIPLETFSFSRMSEKAAAAALTYARENLDLYRMPAPGWRGPSRNTLQYTVKNKGDREILSITVRLTTSGQAYADLPLHGPFPPQKTTLAIAEVPPQVSRSYFTRAHADPSEIASARF